MYLLEMLMIYLDIIPSKIDERERYRKEMKHRDRKNSTVVNNTLAS